jgi:hypothetical protein
MTGKLVLAGIVLAEVYLAVFLQLLIHEAGHLFFGLLSGYDFCSFRIGSFMWAKEAEGVRFRRLTITGTGGQCLMAPPEMKDGKMPVVMYNLGGAILNLFTAGLFLWFGLLLLKLWIVAAGCFFMAAVGFVFAIINGIPMRYGMMDNDGFNARMLAKDKKAMRAFWLQLKINQHTVMGLRLKELPNRWFFMPPDADLKNPMMAALGVLYCNRLMDLSEIEEADEQMKHMLGLECGLNNLYRCLMVCDRMYIAMVTGRPEAEVAAFMTPEQKKFMKAMRDYPSVIRTAYGYALLVEKDETKVQSLLHRFEKCAKSYPYQSEILAEREHLAELKKRSTKEVRA